MEQLHIITYRGKWGIYKRKSQRSIRNFSYRDLAFHHAVSFSIKNGWDIVVHNTDGGVDFIYNYAFDKINKKLK